MRGDSDARLVSRAAVRVGLLTAGLVVAVLVAVSVAVAVLVVHQQERSDEALLAQAARTADDVDDPPAGMWLVLVRGGVVDTTPGLPRDLPDRAALDAAATQGRTSSTHVHLAGRDLQVLTAPRPTGAVQAVLDLRSTDAVRRHVVETTVGVGLVGLVAAAAVAVAVSRRAVRPLADALSLQRTFVADASHELRTPLTLLTTRAQLLRDEIADSGDPALRDDAEGVVRDAGRLADVVDDLLVAADPRADVDRERVDLRTLCDEVAQSALPYATERGIALAVDGGPVVAPVAPTAVRRAVVALVDNAVRHTPAGGRVEVVVGERGATATVTVTDSGPGIDPAVASTLFRRFASGGSGGSGRRSYGLGLALVRDVATRHGGAVDVEPPEPGRGARFVLSLPRSH